MPISAGLDPGRHRKAAGAAGTRRKKEKHEEDKGHESARANLHQ